MGKSSQIEGSKTIPEMLRESRDFVFACILNSALILGVVVFEWSLVEIAVIYLIEIAIINLLFFSVALFTPQSVDDLDGDSWDEEPTPIQPIALIPPVYWRNIKYVLRKAIISAFILAIIMRPVVPGYDLDSGLSLSVGLAIAGTVFFQLARVWRYFIVNRSYQDKSPADALAFAFRPVFELFLMLVFVVAPVSFVIIGTGTDLDSRAVWLLYLVPMGAIRAWMGSLDPQTDDFSVK
ncbi:hypothetical protein [Halopiger xanaduensis]|uniref:Uncharacterized protein n=1 Tax=Halopiger xanaduensis (strain DSM 18323 / JCM 14033 / SH-6) TaxID=797210 RepID=F8DD29_HALXS|nr:hypothetical protein [Halopiger xanaduensis]AEH38916.1 hypothetical protein Halxa_0312 [Halopiger xanaduensis SH-6]